MNILSTNNNINTRNQLYKTAPNFKGGLSSKETERVIKLLSEKNNEVIENFNMSNIGNVINKMVSNHSKQGARSASIMVVNNQDLPKLLKEADKYDTRGKIGLCIAVGDKYGPVENMDKIYEAKTILIYPEALSTK